MFSIILFISLYVIWILILLYLYLYYIVDFDYNQTHSFFHLLFDFTIIPTILIFYNNIMLLMSFRILLLLIFKI
jgi:hypothetical protein